MSVPGELPTTVTPTYGGGATVNRPGQLPVHIRPVAGGGYMVERPGQLPVMVRPSYGASTTTATQVATYLLPVMSRDQDKKDPSGTPKRK